MTADPQKLLLRYKGEVYRRKLQHSRTKKQVHWIAEGQNGPVLPPVYSTSLINHWHWAP